MVGDLIIPGGELPVLVLFLVDFLLVGLLVQDQAEDGVHHVLGKLVLIQRLVKQNFNKMAS